MKKTLIFLALLIITYSHAQDLRKFIPNDAVLVGSINSKNMLESVTINELDNSKMGKSILSKISKSTQDTIKSFSVFNINMNKESYFFYTTNDSISYFTLLLPLKSTDFFDNELEQINVTDKGKFKVKTINTKGNEYVAWDNEKVIFTTGNYSYSYFTDYDFTKIEEEVKLQQKQDTITVIEKTTGIDEVVDTPKKIQSKGENFEKEYMYKDVPYFKNYNLENYAFEYHYLSQDLKKALKDNNTSDLTTTLKLNIENVKKYITKVDSIQESDAEKLDDFIANKEYFLKQRADSITNKKDKNTALNIIEESTFYSNKFKVYPNVVDNYNSNNYKGYYNEKNELQKRWTETQVENLMAPAKVSILFNKSYVDQLDKNAELNIWSENYMASYMKSIGSLYNAFGLSKNNIKNTFSEYGSLSGNLYLNEKEAKFNLDVALKGNLLEVTKSISKHKLNPKFFKYLNEDKFIGYLSYNINMENALKEYPKLISSIYGSILYDKTDEIKVITELISLIIDEKAIAELIEGDAIFLLSDIKEKEVTYTDYEYDENYKYKEIEKTKMETVPEFVFMMSSKEEKFKKSLIKYLLKKQLIKQIGSYYQVIDKKGSLPIGVYFTNNNGIFFLSSSEAEIKAIITNTYQSKISSALKKDLKHSQYAAYFNGKKFSSEVKSLTITDKMAKTLLNNATNFKLKSKLNNEDKVHTELIMEVPSDKKNAIKYILDTFDTLID